MSVKKRSLHLLLVAAAVLGFSQGANAADPTKEECVQANDRQQALRAQNKLRAARDAARTCAAPSCGRLASECAQASYEIEKLIPTIVFEVKDGDGHDLVAVTVSVDGQKIADKLDGTALEVDVGAHDFSFVANGQTVTQNFVIREGDKVRHERITIGRPSTTTTTNPPPVDPPPVSTTPTVPPDVPPPADTGSAGTIQRIIGLAVAGVGLVGGVSLGVAYRVAGNDLNANIPNLCPGGTTADGACKVASEDQTRLDARSTVSTDYVISGVAFGIGGALLVTGLIVFFTAPKAKTSAQSLFVAPSFGNGGGGLLLEGTF